MPEAIADVATFESKIKSPKVSVVHFSANWVEQCQHVNDLLDTLSKQSNLSNVTFYKCEAEDIPEISHKYKIEAVPTVIIYKSGSNIDRVDGADAAKITAKVKEYGDAEKNQAPLEERLKALINKGNVVLFMKGDRNQPRCGFSRQMIEILNGSSVPYETFDILTDEEVRQGLKSYSDWPTYPQLYVKGELIGGLDIVKEIQAAGDLSSTLSG